MSSHPNGKTLAQSFAVNVQIINLQADGLSHTDSLIQPPFRGNCFNWVLGHILVGRNSALKVLGAAPVWAKDREAKYQTGSDPIDQGSGALALEALLADLDESQARLTTALEEATAERLAEAIPFRGNERSRGEALAGLHWHETYHLGQLELLRQLAGKNDAII
ncbi:MAG: DinB family protein [Anaerolineae bacterium]|jgi:uncharacterized damage-inducible protein DinB